MKNSNMKNIYKNRTDRKLVKWCGILVVLAILGPICIHIAYKLGEVMEEPFARTFWGPADVLSYYGTVLGAFIAVVILRITILHEREQALEERLSAKQDEAINKGKNAFFALIAALDDELKTHIYDFTDDSLAGDYELGFIADEIDFECQHIQQIIAKCETALVEMALAALDVENLLTATVNINFMISGLILLKKTSAELRDPAKDTTGIRKMLIGKAELDYCKNKVAEYKAMLAENRQIIDDFFSRVAVMI